MNINGDFILAGNLLPSETNKYNLGSSSKQWLQTYTKYLSVGAGDISSLNTAVNGSNVNFKAVISGDFHTIGISLFDDLLRVKKTGTAAVFGGEATNINGAIYAPTTGIQLCAGSGGATNSTAIGFHNPGISSAIFGYYQINAYDGQFRMRSDNACWDLSLGGTTKLHPIWGKANLLVGEDGSDKIVAGYLADYTNGAVIGAHNSALTTWAPLNVSGIYVNIRNDQTIVAKFLDGCLSLFPLNDNYREGIRIHSYGSWSDILLCGNDNTGDTGTSTNSWFIGNNNGNFYLTRNGSTSSTQAMLSCGANYWFVKPKLGVNGNNINYNFYVEGTSYFNGDTTHNGIDYFANGTTYYINNSAHANMRALGTSENTYISFPQGGGFRTSSSTQTGYLKITLPQSWTDTMMSFKIQFYEYSTGKSCEYTVGGYNYYSGSTWQHNPFAYSVGKCDNQSHSNLTVRFGHDGSKCAIYIGEANTSWAYMQVQVHSIIVGYNNYQYEKWASGWVVGFTTTLGTITATVTNPNMSHFSTNASIATQLGTSTIGSSIKPIYLNNGTATTCSYELGANIKAYSGSLSSGGWATLNGKGNAPSIAIAYNNSAASWNSSIYSASLVFGCQDTRGLLDCAYNTPIVTFGGCSYGGASNDAPTWYMKLSGTNGKIYTLPTDSKTLCASDGTNASGTWGISISGNAATATALTTSAGNAGQPIYFNSGKPATIDLHIGNSGTGEHNCDNITYNMIGYYTSNGPATSIGASTTDGAIYAQAYNSSGVGQIAQDYRNGGLYVRGKNNGTWQAWYSVLDTRNYTSILDNRYVNAAGDTITGELYVDGGTTLASLLVNGDARFVNTIQGNISGNAGSATKLQTARSIALSGAVTGSASFDGSGNITIATTSATSNTVLDNRYVKKTGDTMTGSLINTSVRGGMWISGTHECTFFSSQATTASAGNYYQGHYGLKTPSGAWSLGILSGSNDLYFVYGTDANYNTGSNSVNTTVRIASNGGLYGAVWNDYAEFRQSYEEQPGRVVYELGNDCLAKTINRLQHFAGIISDTFGFAEGETNKAKTPLAVAGRVLAYPYQDRNNYKPGDCVCAAPNGTVDIMTREEIIQYPDRIVGTVSCVPEYETWGTGNVKVNGRIWIKVK